MSLISKDYTPAAPAVCATFTLTPYSLSASGAQTQAGSAVTIAGTSAGVTPILGCVHTPGVSPDWRYLVTATNFAGCTSTIAGITPAIETFTVDVTCTPGQDVSAQVIAQVSIPVANDAGYIDIGVGVNVSTPQSGCKVADIDSNGQLHFGQSFVETTGGPTPSAYTGIGVFTPPATSGPGPAAGSVHQFVGSVFSGTQSDAFFTGLFTLPAAPQTTTLVQAFTQACPAGQMTIQPHAVECVTQATLPSSTNTQVQVADVFASWPGRAAVSASITGGNTITLNTSLAGQHLGSLPATTGYDNLTNTQAMQFPDVTVIGLYGSLVHSDELLALISSATQGVLMVPLNLDESTGQWSAGPEIALSTLTLARQHEIGLFGPGGCYPDPIPACVATSVKKSAPRPAVVKTSGPTGTLNITLTHKDGTPVDAANPAIGSPAADDQVTVHLQWSVSGLASGQYAYPAITLCSPFVGLTNLNGGQYIGPPCLDGYNTQDTHSVFAFPGLTDPSGGVTQNLQFTLAVAGFFTDVPSWTVPFALYVGNSSTPDLANDTLVPETNGVTGVTIPLAEIHNRYVTIDLLSSTKVASGGPNGAPGIIFKLQYTAGTVTYYNIGRDPHYLEGHSVIELSPPSITNGLDAWLVPGSATVESQLGSGSLIPYPGFAKIIADKAINTNLPAAPTITPDAVHGGIPTVGVDNLLSLCCSGEFAPTFSAEWYVPLPTQQGTIMTVSGAITWNGTTDSHSGFDIHNNATLDLSPVPVNLLKPFAYHSCLDGYLGQNWTLTTSLAAQYNQGHYLPDGTFVAAPTATPQFPADPTPSGCEWVYNWHGEYYFTAQRFIGGDNYAPATLINPLYVFKTSPNEYISSPYIFNDGNSFGSAYSISSSDDASCDNTNIGDTSIWTELLSGSKRTDYTATRCVRIQYYGVTPSPGFVKPFVTRLKPSITTPPPAIGSLRFTTTMFWATADNVLPIPGDATNNTWATGWSVANWNNTTFLESFNEPGTQVPVETVIGAQWDDAHSAGLSVPDLIFTYTIAPGAVFDTTTTPESWFVQLSHDDNGAQTVPTCVINGSVLTCTLRSPTGALIPGEGGTFVNDTAAVPKFKFLASESYNGEQKPRTLTMATSAAWLSSAGVPIQFNPPYGATKYDTVIGPNSLAISKTANTKSGTAFSGGAVPFDITYGAQGLNSGQLGAGGVAIFDFLGRDYQAGANGAPGTLVAQPGDCVAPIATKVQYVGNSGPSQPTQGPDFYSTIDASPGITGGTWVLVPPSGTLPAGTTAIKIVPYSSKGAAGVLLPIDGDGTVQITIASPAGAAGRLCNSATLTANLFQPTATPEATVTILPPCDQNPWSGPAQQK